MSATARRTTVLAAVSTALLAAFAAAPGALAATGTPAPSTVRPASTALTGYAATGSHYTSVSADWAQPAVTCAHPDSAAAFWIGLDGVDDATLEQTGTAADCSSGTPAYHGWYEMYPAAPVYYTNPVSAGDRFTSSVTTDGAGHVTLTLTDTTKGWSKTTTKTATGATFASAEVIAEVPTGAVAGQPLPNTVSFTDALVNGSAIGKLDPEQLDAPGVTVSPLTNGENFTVSWGLG